MSLHDPFEYYNTRYGQKKGQESKCQYDFRPLKVNNHPKLHLCRWCAIYLWKVHNERYNFALNLVSINDLHKKLWASKVIKVPISRILKLLTWEFRET
jgi:hypothetical protein